MTEQSEHLSNAQIENYGIRTSGAGPEAAERDEHQRANHQSIDGLRINDQSINDRQIGDQRVEAHLADCAPCRNRLLGFHRSLFTGAADPPEADPPGNAPSENRISPSGSRSADAKLEGARPTNSALADSKFANPNDPVDPQVRTVPTPACPSTEALRELAAGLTPDDLAPTLTRHAATCDHCGPLLRSFTEDFSDDFSPEEQAVLNNLQSASTDWQKNTAREMLQAARVSAAGDASAARASAAEAGGSATAATVKPDKKSSTGRSVSTASDRKPFFWKWTLVPAAAVVTATVLICGVVGFGTWYAKRDTPEKVEKLLAQAYTEDRTMELRWPGAAWGPVRVTRGAEESHFSRPTTLLRAEKVIAGRQVDGSSGTDWLTVKAEAELLDREPQAAIDDLTQTLNSDPSSSRIKLLLAIAYAYQGNRKESATSREKALQFLNEVLETEPTNPTALFNRALLYGQLNLPDRAIADWNILLSVEKDSRWFQEVHDKLGELQRRKN